MVNLNYDWMDKNMSLKDLMPLIAMLVTAGLAALIWALIVCFGGCDEKQEDNGEGLNCECCMATDETEIGV